MHNNYFFLRKLVEALKPLLIGGVFRSVYTQNRNELIAEVEVDGEVRAIRASVDPGFSCLSFPGEMHRARKNSVDLFEALSGRAVTGVTQIAFDRSFYISAEGAHHLLFKMHGNRSNVLLFVGDQCTAVFRNNLRSDHDLRLSELGGKADLSKKAFFEVEGDLRRLAPVFGRDFQPYLERHRYHRQGLEDKWQIFSALLHELETPEYCISEEDQLPVFRLYKDDHTKICYGDPLQAINRFHAMYSKARHLIREKSNAHSMLSSRISKTTNYLSKARGKLQKLRKNQRYDQWADIIMANLHRIDRYRSEVVLFDFYNNRDVRIPMKKDLSPQENAANYYRKSKNQSIEIKQLEDSIRSKQTTLGQLRADLDTIEGMTSAREIASFMKKKLPEAKKAGADAPASLRRYLLGDWEILVGKNNRANDQLTFGTAHKNDYWLHVKDAPGSHVLIKNSGRAPVPKHVLEYAASIAALHSKRRTESLCPVTLTQKKYVRKGKGLPPGRVIIDREEVLLVPPLKDA